MAGFTAFYEPLNENRWFDPATRGTAIDKTHRGVSDYAANYQGLERLGTFFTEDWTYRRLVMSAQDTDEALTCYIEGLIQVAPERPVLQFNRVDFRLPFLHAQFPQAFILHFRRNVRDSWRSVLRGEENDWRWNLISFEEHCHFYTLAWYRDLAVSYPWLLRNGWRTHPYFMRSQTGHHGFSRG